MELLGKDHEYTKLIIKHDGVDPEDVYSTVAYEKGFHFLYYLEGVVGREYFNKFIPFYFTKWAGKSLDSFEFKDTFVDFFNNLGDEEVAKKVAEIDWEAKFYTPGLPPKPKFDTSLADQCYELANKWKDSVSHFSPLGMFQLLTRFQSYEPSPTDLENFTANQKLVFLAEVQQFEPLSPERSQLLGKTYELTTSKNVELLSSFYAVALKAQDTTAYAPVADLLGRVGRMKYVRPGYRALNKVDRQLALDTFEKHKDFYHPICRGMVEKDLGL